MNKTDVRSALDVLERSKLEELKRGYKQAHKVAFDMYKEKTFGASLEELEKTFEKLSKSEDIKYMLCTIEDIKNRFNGVASWGVEYIMNDIIMALTKISECDKCVIEVESSYWNSKEKDVDAMVLKIDKEYRQKRNQITKQFKTLDNMLRSMTAKQFITAMQAQGLNLEVKKVEKKKNLPTTQIDLSLIL